MGQRDVLKREHRDYNLTRKAFFLSVHASCLASSRKCRSQSISRPLEAAAHTKVARVGVGQKSLAVQERTRVSPMCKAEYEDNKQRAHQEGEQPPAHRNPDRACIHPSTSLQELIDQNPPSAFREAVQP